MTSSQRNGSNISRVVEPSVLLPVRNMGFVDFRLMINDFRFQICLSAKQKFSEPG